MLANIVAVLGNATVVLALRILILALFSWGGFRLIEAGRKLFDRRVVQAAKDPSRKARLATLLDASVMTLRLLLIGAIALMALMAVGIDIGPVLAAAGIVGLAVSLGAQALIKDFIGGTLILLEDQFRVGDVIRVENTEGTVERMSLRVSYVRDLDGRLWSVPNGDIRIMSNATRDWSRAVVELNLSLTADIKQAVAVLAAAMEQAGQDPALQPMLLETPFVEGYTGINDWAVQVRLRATTRAGQQWATARLLRERGLAALRDVGIPLASRIQVREDGLAPA